jgi:tyrosine-protein phosphatase SIW14
VTSSKASKLGQSHFSSICQGPTLHLSSEMSRYRVTAIAFVLFSTIVVAGCSARHALHTDARAVSPPAFAEKISVPGISDFGKVNDFLYRGSQPTDDGVEQLKKLGIDTIVDLRGKLHGVIDHERQQAESLGIRFINLPGSGWATAKDEQIAEFFSLIRERPRRKIFIHCWLGGDRSGMFIAAYRIAFEGWSPQQAIEEMRSFHYLHFWHPNMARWVERFPDHLAESPQLASFRETRSSP